MQESFGCNSSYGIIIVICLERDRVSDLAKDR